MISAPPATAPPPLAVVHVTASGVGLNGQERRWDFFYRVRNGRAEAERVVLSSWERRWPREVLEDTLVPADCPAITTAFRSLSRVTGRGTDDRIPFDGVVLTMEATLADHTKAPGFRVGWLRDDVATDFGHWYGRTLMALARCGARTAPLRHDDGTSVTP